MVKQQIRIFGIQEMQHSYKEFRGWHLYPSARVFGGWIEFDKAELE